MRRRALVATFVVGLGLVAAPRWRSKCRVDRCSAARPGAGPQGALMSAADWLAITGYCALVVLLGSGAIRAWGLPPSRPVRDWSACYLAGQLLLTLATLSTGFVPWTRAQLVPAVVVAAVASGIAGAGAAGSSRRVATVGLATAGFVLLAIAMFPNLLMLVHRSPALAPDRA
jgi:hypothetical protein